MTEPDAAVARAAVAAIGQLGVRVPSCGAAVVDQLLKLLEVRRSSSWKGGFDESTESWHIEFLAHKRRVLWRCLHCRSTSTTSLPKQF